MLGKRGATFIGGVVSIAIGAIVLANVFISSVKGVNTSTWTTQEVALWGILTLSGIIGLVYGVLNVFGIV